MAATVIQDKKTAVRILEQELSTGRVARATLNVVADNSTGTVVKDATISITQPGNMTDAELTLYQTFCDGLDEIVTALKASLTFA